ncbi:MAG: hypothetical protein N3A53_01090 [Verrucomicrobiae bacterium]|nr:hypothetical protein [Verrucomicrobiae bacterium]
MASLREYALRGDLVASGRHIVLPTDGLTMPGRTRYLTVTHRQNKVRPIYWLSH